MHPELLTAYHRAIPRLEAREQLGQRMVIGLAMGTMRAEDARAALSALTRAAEWGRPARRLGAADLERGALPGIALERVSAGPRSAQDADRGAGGTATTPQAAEDHRDA